MPHLLVEIAGKPLRRYPIGADPVVIGSGPRCQVRIQEPGIAEEHAVVTQEIAVADLASGSGVLWRGRKIEREILDDREPFALGAGGNVRIRLVHGSLEAGGATAGAVASEAPSRKPPASGTAAPGAAAFGFAPSSAPPAFTGAAPGQEAELQRRVRELENDKAALQAEALMLRERIQSLEGQATTAAAAPERAALDQIAQTVFGSDALAAAPGTTMLGPQIKIVCIQLITFLRDIEADCKRLIIVRPLGEGSLVPGKSLDDMLQQVLRSNPTIFSSELKEFLGRTRKRWERATLFAYHRAVEAWAADFLIRRSPREVERRAGILTAKKDLGGGYAKVWDLYRSEMSAYGPDIIIEEIEDAVRRLAP